MIPKIHAKGSSFVGLGKYVLHDKDGAETSDRVDWTHTRNLATDDPELAVRVMAATAMDADRLKANAGVKRTGRKSDKSVLHVTLAWHPDQRDQLTPEEMLRAADLAIRALGAEDRQALIVSHTDEDQKHLHLMINRVSPEDGRMLTSSKEKLNLSRFAQQYEQECGEILCHQRVINNKARDRGEYTRGEQDVPRHIYEQHRANENRPGAADRHRTQREKDREIGQMQRSIRAKQAAAWNQLERTHKLRREAILELQKREVQQAERAVRDAYRADQWTRLHHEHMTETRVFERNEGTFLGRLRNRSRAINLRGLVGSDDRRKAISETFTAISSSGARLMWLKRTQHKRERALRAEQRRAESVAAREVREQTRERLREARTAYMGERASLAFRCAGESAKMRAQWRSRRQDRAAAFDHDAPPPQQAAEDTSLSDLISDFKRIHDQLDRERGQDNENER